MAEISGQSQAERAYAAPEEQIITLQLPPGQLVSGKIQAARLGIGRTSVRNAIRQLSWEGLLVILPKRGIMISEIDGLRQLELLEARRAWQQTEIHARLLHQWCCLP